MQKKKKTVALFILFLVVFYVFQIFDLGKNENV